MNEVKQEFIIKTYDDIFSYVVSDPRKMDVLEAITLRLIDINLARTFARHEEGRAALSQAERDHIVYTVYDSDKVDDHKLDAQKLLMDFIHHAKYETILAEIAVIKLDISEAKGQILRDVSQVKKDINTIGEPEKITARSLRITTIEHCVGAFSTAVFFIAIAASLPYISPVIGAAIEDLSHLIKAIFYK